MKTKPFAVALFSVALLAAQLSFADTKPADLFAAQVTNHFQAWDRDRDGKLSNSELDAVVSDPKVTGQTAATIAALKRSISTTKYKAPALTLTNILALAAAKPSTNAPNFAKMYSEGWRQITNATHRELFITGGPKLESVHQGKLGNCFTLAPIGAMLGRDPQQVAGMFSAETNGTYRVKLGKQTVCVAPPTESEIAMTSSSESSGVWMNIYEKALGTARNESKPEAERSSSPIDAIARGGSAGTMLSFITGHDITRFTFKFAKDSAVTESEREAKLSDLRKQLASATSQKRLMTCGTIKPTTPGITPNHAYAVLGYDEKSDKVKLWNPHGGTFKPKGAEGLENGYPQADGIFQMPVAEFVQQFSGMAFEVVEVAVK